MLGIVFPISSSGPFGLRLDDVLLRNQLINLERRTTRAGKDSIDHGPGAFDDLINAVAGAINETVRRSDLLFEHLRCGVDGHERLSVGEK